MVEHLDSLSGTFVNDLRVERATLHDGDWILIGKLHIKVDSIGDATIPWDATRKAVAPKINETMVLNTKARRDMLQQAAAIGQRSQFSLGRLKMPTLVVLGGRLDQKEYVLTNRLTVIGKSPMAAVPLRGWFVPKMAAQINQRDDGYYLGTGDKVPTVNGTPIPGTVPQLTALPPGCAFEPRCAVRVADCVKRVPDMRNAGTEHEARCVLV